jgi:hypothetical protein
VSGEEGFFEDHEVLSAFDREGFRLNTVLYEMLNEHYKHRTERRGAGFTQATRHLAEHVNLPRHHYECDEVRLFANRETFPLRELLDCAEREGFRLGWRTIGTQDPPEELRNVPHFWGLYARQRERQERFCAMRSRVTLEESRILASLLCDLFFPRERDGLCELPPYPDKLPIGTCPLAEKYFLELADGFVRRNGQMNVIISHDGEPLLLEKLSLGDDHSCISLTEVVLNGVRLPAGSLIGARYEGDISLRSNRSIAGQVIPLDRVTGFRFLRLTTLSISPENRRRAFTRHFDAQVEGGLFAPGSVTIGDLKRGAEEQL